MENYSAVADTNQEVAGLFVSDCLKIDLRS